MIKCPLCDSTDVHIISSRKNVPVLQNIICKNKDSARQIECGNINLFTCTDCGFVFNSDYHNVNYDDSYENNQKYSPLFGEYMRKRAKSIAAHMSSLSGNSLILEIGCGQGDFLCDVLNELSTDMPITAVGFDPACRCDGNGVFHAVPEYFSKEAFDRNIKGEFSNIVCISRHVIEHIPNPNFIVKECAELHASEVELFLETPDFRWIMEHSAFEDIVYEHCSFFTHESIQYLLRRFNFQIIRHDNTFDGQYMWIQSRKVIPLTNGIAKYRKAEEQYFYEWDRRLHEWNAASKRVFVWGAGAKGVAFLNIFDRAASQVEAVVDINPHKQGNFIPGTGHPIVSPAVLRNIDDEAIIIVMNEIYLNEIQSKIESINSMGAISMITLRAESKFPKLDVHKGTALPVL